MLMYPEPLKHFPKAWIEEVAAITRPEDVVRLEKKDFLGLISSPDLLKFYERIEELSRLPQAPELPPMSENAFTFLYVTPKKQHEIRKLAPYVYHFYHQHQVKGVVDIGGGIGLLAQTLCNQYNLKVMSLDMDPALQKTGRERHEKNHRYPDNKVSYHLIKVAADEPQFKALLNPDLMTIGLHACGALSLDQIHATVKNQVNNLINFGCCYYKIASNPEAQNISSFARSLPSKIIQSPFALTLSTRAHKKMNDKDYTFKLKVKFYRYAMHFLLHDEYKMPGMVTLGNTHPKLYAESFGVYALDQLQRISVIPKHSIEELNSYFSDVRRQELIWKMLAAGLIRNAFGRPLEIYLLLDRAIYLEEHGYQAELMEFFDEEKSPRNIGLAAARR
jgi:hypothetical protein